MPRCRLICLGFLLASLMTLGGTALAEWRALIFDGRDIRPVNRGERPAFRYQEGYLPFVDYSGRQAQGFRLPAGTGGLAGICFVQVAGGKAHTAPSYLPLGGEPVEI